MKAVLSTLATKADVADTKTLVVESKADVIKWLAELLFAATALILSVMAVLLNRATQAPPPQAAPIVIQLPAQPAPSGGDAAKPGKSSAHRPRAVPQTVRTRLETP